MGDTIGKTIKVGDTTRATARGRFARICVEIDLDKPLVASYRLQGRKDNSNMKDSTICVSRAGSMATKRLDGR